MMMMMSSKSIVAAVLSLVFAATVSVQAQDLVQGSGPYCINDLMCSGQAIGMTQGICLGCPKRTEDDSTLGDCEFTLPEDSGDTSKDGGKSGKKKKNKKSRRRLKKKSNDGDDDDDEDEDSGGINGDPIFNANCCDCECIKRTPEEACTCICYGFLDPTDGSTIGGGSGSSKKKKNKKSRRRNLEGDEEDDLTVHDEESHVRSRLARRAEAVDAEATGDGWHSWLLNSLWGGEDDEELGVLDSVDDEIDELGRNLKKNKKSKNKKSKNKKNKKKKDSSPDEPDDPDDGDGEDEPTGTAPPTDENGCVIPPAQCFYIKREDPASTVLPENQCAINTYGRCATAADLTM